MHSNLACIRAFVLKVLSVSGIKFNCMTVTVARVRNCFCLDVSNCFSLLYGHRQRETLVNQRLGAHFFHYILSLAI